MSLVIGVDSSTQSCKVEVRDAHSGMIRGRGRALHTPTSPPVSEQSPEQWWQAFIRALKDASRTVALRDVGAISIVAQTQAVVLVNDSGVPIRAAKLWNDTTALSEAETVRGSLTGSAWIERVGCIPTGGFPIVKLKWLAEHATDDLQRTRVCCSPHEYLTYRLTGTYVAERSDASATGYFSPFTNTWDYDILRRVVGDFDWEMLLPPIVDGTAPAGQILEGVANALGLPRGVVVAAGAGDQPAAALGVMAEPGDLLFSIGTSGVVMSPTPEPVTDPSGHVACSADTEKGFLPQLCTMNAAKVTDAVASWLGVTVDELSSLALGPVRSDERPLFVARLDGEQHGSPDLSAGVLSGLSGSTTREDIARAAFKGVLLAMAEMSDEVSRVAGGSSTNTWMVGGGSRSPAYRQLLADLLDKPVLTRSVPDASVLGACAQAAAVTTGTAPGELIRSWSTGPLNVTEARPGGGRDLRAAYRAASSPTTALLGTSPA